jgi:hypothetical protein
MFDLRCAIMKDVWRNLRNTMVTAYLIIIALLLRKRLSRVVMFATYLCLFHLSEKSKSETDKMKT